MNRRIKCSLILIIGFNLSKSGFLFCFIIILHCYCVTHYPDWGGYNVLIIELNNF